MFFSFPVGSSGFYAWKIFLRLVHVFESAGVNRDSQSVYMCAECSGICYIRVFIYIWEEGSRIVALSEECSKRRARSQKLAVRYYKSGRCTRTYMLHLSVASRRVVNSGLLWMHQSTSQIVWQTAPHALANFSQFSELQSWKFSSRNRRKIFFFYCVFVPSAMWEIYFGKCSSRSLAIPTAFYIQITSISIRKGVV